MQIQHLSDRHRAGGVMLNKTVTRSMKLPKLGTGMCCRGMKCTADEGWSIAKLKWVQIQTIDTGEFRGICTDVRWATNALSGRRLMGERLDTGPRQNRLSCGVNVGNRGHHRLQFIGLRGGTRCSVRHGNSLQGGTRSSVADWIVGMLTLSRRLISFDH